MQKQRKKILDEVKKANEKLLLKKKSYLFGNHGKPV